MEIFDVCKEEYEKTFDHYFIPYNTPEFNCLNKHKADELKFLLFRTASYKLGIICGIKDSVLKIPFSAPFGCFETVKGITEIQHYMDALKCMEVYAQEIEIESIEFTAPPEFYNSDNISKTVNALFVNGFSVDKIDLSFYFNLRDYNYEHYLKNLNSNARNMLIVSFRSNICFNVCKSTLENKKAYEVIKQNHAEKRYPLHLSFEDIIITANIIPIQFFLITKDDIPIAAAMVYTINSKIAQVIYWGSLEEFKQYKPMNFLTFNLFRYYKEKSIDVLDIGPSTVNSVANIGLCRFKQSVGCHSAAKLSFKKKL